MECSQSVEVIAGETTKQCRLGKERMRWLQQSLSLQRNIRSRSTLVVYKSWVSGLSSRSRKGESGCETRKNAGGRCPKAFKQTHRYHVMK